MGDFLTEVKTVTLRQREDQGKPQKPLLEEIQPAKPLIQPQRVHISSPEDVLQTLRSQPDIEALEHVLIYLNRRQDEGDFNIKVPSPSSAKIINELVSTTISDFWGSLSGLKHLFLECLRSVAGIGAVLARLRLLTTQYQPSKEPTKPSSSAQPILDLIAVLSQLLQTDHLLHRVFQDVSRFVESPAKRDMLWKEFIASIASGRIISAVAEAEILTEAKSSRLDKSWVSDGSEYSAWLGRSLAVMLRHSTSSDSRGLVKAATLLCGKSFNIGYPAKVVEEIQSGLSLASDVPVSILAEFLEDLQAHEQRQFLLLTMRFTSKRNPSLQQVTHEFADDLLETSDIIAGGAALLRATLTNQIMKDHLIAWLSDPALSSSEPFTIRRMAIAAIASTGGAVSVLDEDPMQSILESNWKTFGDQLFIKHSPIIQQEACAQVVLVAASYVHRAQPMFLFTLARSSVHLNCVSNRLNTSSQRARFLGMIVGTAISALVDKEGSKLDFDVEATKTQEAQWYRQLTKVDDRVGTVEEMRKTFGEQGVASSKPITSRKTGTAGAAKKNISPVVQTEIKGPRIMEVLDDEEDEEDEEDDDLIPYEKPDSDPEDDDEDPTLINRDKAKAPVYIRDLIAGLHDSENHDRHTIALRTAASLIRRKTSFGKEVADHAIELALILIGLSNTFDVTDFDELRLQALIAILLSAPALLAPWFARQVFDGDYSLSQRMTLLSTLGLSARELAGFKEEDSSMNPSTQADASFPSKQLPPRLHKLYTASSNPTTLISTSLSKSFLQPIAASAADSLSGPNILKVRTFSSRMAVESRRKKPISNALAKIVAEAFFFPLTGHWWQNLQAHGGAGRSQDYNVQFQPMLLSTYLKTLAILLHASGPATLSLAQLTEELWGVALRVRTHAFEDVAVLEAVLFVFLTILEINEDKRGLAEEFGKELMETQGWVELVFERSSGGGDDEEGRRVRMLAAGVLVKTREVVEKHQRLLVGSMMDY